MRSAAISAARRRHLDREEHRDAEPHRPHGGDEHGQPHVQAACLGDVQQAGGSVRAAQDETDQDDDQQHDAAEVAHAPAEGTDRADGLRRRDQWQQRVVEHRRQLVEDRPDRDADQAEPQVTRLVPDQHHGEQAGHDDTGVDPQPQLAAAGGIAALARHRGHDRDDHARDRGEHAEQLGFVRGVAERLARQVRVENEGGGHGVEGREGPVPQAPGQHGAPGGAGPGGGGSAGSRRDVAGHARQISGSASRAGQGRPGQAGPAPR